MNDEVEKQCIVTMMEAAERGHLVEIRYRKPADQLPSVRLVEPYRFEVANTSIMIRCWQVQPPIVYDDAWRNFRTDRIVQADHTGRRFSPRIPVTLHTSEAHEFRFGESPKVPPTPGKRYADFIERAMLDGRITSEEVEQARGMGQDLPEEQRRAVHARVFANVIEQALIDGIVDDAECHYLAGVSMFLGKLGWAPGR